MKKVLLVSISAPPKTGAESIQTARYLKYLYTHFDIKLLTSEVNRKGWRKIDHSLDRYAKHTKKNIKVFTFTNTISRLLRYNILPSSFVFPDSDFLFHVLGMLTLKQVRSFNPDIIYSRSTPYSSAVLAYKLKKKLNIPWIMHLSDPWVGNPYNNWSNKITKKSDRLERVIFDNADIITLTSETAVKLYVEKYPERKNDILYFPNVYDKLKNPISEHNENKLIRITYTGNIYKQRGLYPLIKTIEYIKSNYIEYSKTFEVLIAGNIDEYNISKLKESDQNIIKYIGHLNYSESTKLISSSDILVTIDKQWENEFDNTFFPSKIMDYIAVDKTILGITHNGSPTYQLVHNRFGKCFNHNEIPAISRFIIDEINRLRKNLMSNFNPEREIIQFFSAKHQTEKLKKTIEKLMV